MKRFFLIEYGSWTVFVATVLGGWAFVEGPFPLDALPVITALAFLMNSKVALKGWINRGDNLSRWVFLAQLIIAAALVLPFLDEIPPEGVFYIIPVVAVFFVSLFGKDHKVYGELLGFGYLCLPSAVVVLVSGQPLHLKVYVFFWAFYSMSVFKVRFFMKKTTLWRVLTGISPLLAGTVVATVGFSPFYALLHLENTLYAIGIKRKGLAYVGWTELLKAVTLTAILWIIPPK